MIDNEFYKELGEKWFSSEGDAVALLRQENLTKLPWVRDHLPPRAKVLDIGCGGGFLSLGLAAMDFAVTALDVSESVLSAGRVRDTQHKISWVVGVAEKLPFPDASFDAVCLMDMLEHVSDPRLVLAEAVRVLKPGGVLLAHTFNRTATAWLFAARGLDWFIRDSQAHVHDWKMFIKPRELRKMLHSLNAEVKSIEGIQPVIFSLDFLRLLVMGRVPKTFRFKTGRSLKVGYLVQANRLAE